MRSPVGAVDDGDGSENDYQEASALVGTKMNKNKNYKCNKCGKRFNRM